jgi:hypothetical protein
MFCPLREIAATIRKGQDPNIRLPLHTECIGKECGMFNACQTKPVYATLEAIVDTRQPSASNGDADDKKKSEETGSDKKSDATGKEDAKDGKAAGDGKKPDTKNFDL